MLCRTCLWASEYSSCASFAFFALVLHSFKAAFFSSLSSILRNVSSLIHSFCFLFSSWQVPLTASFVLYAIWPILNLRDAPCSEIFMVFEFDMKNCSTPYIKYKYNFFSCEGGATTPSCSYKTSSKTVSAFCSFVESPSKFWLQLEERHQEACNLMKLLNNNLKWVAVG